MNILIDYSFIIDYWNSYFYLFVQSSIEFSILFSERMGNQIPTQDQTKAHTARAFVVNCMDFRLVDDNVYFMDKLGFNTNYDSFALAGVSLGFTQDKYPEWGKSLIDHLTIGKALHHLRYTLSKIDKSFSSIMSTAEHIVNSTLTSNQELNN